MKDFLFYKLSIIHKQTQKKNDEKVMPGIKLKVIAENDEAISLLVNILVDKKTNIVAVKYKIGTGNLIQFSVLPHK